MLWGINIVAVPAGTVIRDPRMGEHVTVHDDNMVMSSGFMHVTEPTYQALKDRSSNRVSNLNRMPGPG